MEKLLIVAHATHGGGKGKVISSAYGTTVVKANAKKVGTFMKNTRTRSGIKASGSKLRQITGARTQRRQDRARNQEIANQFASKNYTQKGELSAAGRRKLASAQRSRG